MNIIFLDIDGVLNTERYRREQIEKSDGKIQYPHFNFDPVALENLRQIVEESDARIVISSTWRINANVSDDNPLHRYWKSIVQNLAAHGSMDRRIIGITPNVPGENVTRGAEIKEWLKANADKKITRFVIIDDDTRMEEFTEFCLAHCAGPDGINNLVKEKALKILTTNIGGGKALTYLRDPLAIEALSYDFIARELGDSQLTDGEKAVLTRIIHATGDHSFARLIAFHPDFITSAVAALQSGAGIFTDIEMVRSGINARLAETLGCKVFCAIREPDVIAAARMKKGTRAIVAMESLADRMEGGLVAIGNAPTALFRLLELIEAGDARPAAVVGVPVGFVGAAESKAALAMTDIPHVVVQGTKGGSAIAVAAVNALLKLAVG